MVQQKKERGGGKVRNVNDLVNIQQKYLVIGSKKKIIESGERENELRKIKS